MPNLNKVMLMGNLTRDPELKYMPSNTAVVDFTLAVNRRWRSQEGEDREETAFIDCTAFARRAEVINQYLKKGRPLFVEGRLRQEKWQDKDTGGNRSKLSVLVDHFEFIDSRDSGESGGNYSSPKGSSHSASSTQDTPAPSAAGVSEPHHPVNESDIPF